ncbi:MAG: hypothetical protein ABI716_02400 [Candidatus Saccharibacteria bacterium]
MSASYTSGFTIIETMLFLAVTGVLVVGILAGTGTSINIQRYRDSASSLKSLIEQQYADNSSVHNGERATAISCDVNATVSSGGTLSRGQSDCVELGRYLTIDDNAATTTTIVGQEPATLPVGSDIEKLQAYKLSLLQTDTITSSVQTPLEWGSRIAWPKSGAGSQTPTTPRWIGLLILRSPTSGLTYTFSSNDRPPAASTSYLHDMIIAGAADPNKGQSQQRICVDSNGGFGGGLAVVIGAYASSASSLQVRSNEMGDGSTC